MLQSGKIAVARNDLAPLLPSKHVCIHLRGSLRADIRGRRNVQALVDAGFQVSIIDFEEERGKLRERQAQGASITHIYAPNLAEPSLLNPKIALKLLRMFIRSSALLLKTQADVYHAGDLRALPATYLAARLRRKPLIFETYELPLSQPYLTKHRLFWRLAVRCLKTMLRRCDGVIATSPLHAVELQRRYGGPPATLIRNLPVYQAPVKSDRLRRHLHLDAKTRIVLYQGGFQESRSLDKLISTAQYLDSDTVIVLLGAGESQPALEALIAALGVEDRVKILPAVPYDELLEWTASADLGVTLFVPDWSTSLRLSLPNKLFEYMMAGLPTLTTPLDAVVDIINTYGVGGVVSSAEPAELARAINAMLDADAAALERMRRRAQEAIKNELCWEREQERLVRLYYRVLSKPTYARAAVPVR